ncbi:trichohyalin-like [Osmia bicornis bicornis]|uniref:trichohyalin-like n=1 Tax=Osmia bicornis bicornis TaxID=1437191 RepID=UPI001EAEADA5|nr:trichohyalin-like [Osmia bicornis bicornis]
MPGDKEEADAKGVSWQQRKEETKEKKKIAEGREEAGKIDKGVRRGRPTNVEVLKREKSLSVGNMSSIEDIWKRKRETETGEEEERGGVGVGGGNQQTEGWIFRGSSLIERSPDKKKEKMEEEGGFGELKEMIKKLGEGQKGLGERIDSSTRALGKEMREEIAGIKGEIGKLKEEMKRREDKWLEQKKDMDKKIEALRKKMEELEGGERQKENTKLRMMEERMQSLERGAAEKSKEESENEAVKVKLRELERKWEWKEKEERKKNIIVKGIKVKREDLKKSSEELLKEIGVQDAIEEVKPVGYADGGKEVNMVQLRLRTMEHKRIVMEKKKTLKGRDEKIEEDLTWRERRIQWKLRSIAREEREKGRFVWVDHGRIRIEVLMETWLEKKGWEKIEGGLPKGYRWEAQLAERKNKKGRAMGGMLVGVKEGLMGKEGKIIKEEEEEKGGLLTMEFTRGEEKWRVVGVYVNADIEEKMKKLRTRMEDVRDERITIIGGDFNARTGEEGGGRKWRDGEEGEGERKSKDKKQNAEGRVLLEALRETGWEILNGNISGDEEGEFTYTGARGSTVIDYVLVEEGGKEKIKRMEIGDRIDSDHHPMILKIEGRGAGKEEERGRKKQAARGDWTEQGRERFKKEIKWREARVGQLEEDMERMLEEFRKGLERGRKGTKISKRKGWWDEESMKKKKEVRKILRDWRKGRVGGERYREAKREYNRLCEAKKEKENERFEREVEEARTESDVWKIINKEKKRRGRVKTGIEREEWRKHFVNLLGGSEEKVVLGGERERERDEEADISKEEIRKVVAKLKDGKATGGDEIPNEVWRYGGEEVLDWAWEVCNRVWRGEGWPEGWKEGIIAPIKKKGDGTRATDYRGVTLMPTLYKIYAAILTERLREEAEEKGMIPANQTGFRRGMGTVDNIYVLNYLVNRQIKREKGKVIAFFVDLKAAFDSVDRGVLLEALKQRGVREGLRTRIKEILRETRSRERSREMEKDELVVEGKENRRGGQVQIPRICFKKKRRKRAASKGQNQQGRSSDETNMGDWKKKIWEKLEEKNLDMGQASMDDRSIRSRDMGVEGVEGDRSTT